MSEDGRPRWAILFDELLGMLGEGRGEDPQELKERIVRKIREERERESVAPNSAAEEIAANGK